MTEAELAAIEERAKAATEEPGMGDKLASVTIHPRAIHVVRGVQVTPRKGATFATEGAGMSEGELKAAVRVSEMGTVESDGKCQTCGRVGGVVITFHADGFDRAAWACPHCMARQREAFAAELRRLSAAIGDAAMRANSVRQEVLHGQYDRAIVEADSLSNLLESALRQPPSPGAKEKKR